ncbi:hypothetical protein MNBD_GAMMA11-3260 [hydrothermal vent metagenome]|uniref:DUF3179 domain-containing protein n=1 Tax=hydrothermal vent metagenome TaxID=652676 RepID=A0A3B0XSN3_9ZZZZ
MFIPDVRYLKSGRFYLYSSLLMAGLYIIVPNVFSAPFNDFVIQSPLIPKSEISGGGPVKDGIPSIDKPEFVSADQADFLKKDDRVLGLKIAGHIKAYPIKILNWHEIVNDGNILLSYCPLCGTGMAFNVPDADFGVSGLLYNSDMLLYDRATESLWSQIMAQAISGKRKGEKLSMLVVENTHWENWLKKHPNTLVLSTRTGFGRDYNRSPYGSYDSSGALYFPVSSQSRRYHPKEKVIGIQINENFKAYPFVELSKSGSRIISDEVGGEKIEVHFNSEYRSATVKLQSGELYPSVMSYWFAWFAFHPDTQVYVFR